MADILNFCRNFDWSTLTPNVIDVGFSLLASAYLVYLSILKFEVYTTFKMATMTSYIKCVSRKKSNFVKNDQIFYNI